MTRRFILLLTVVLATIGSCSPIRYTPLALDPAWQLVYVADEGSIYADAAEDTTSHCIYYSGAQVVLPRCSPDGARVAFYQFSDRRGALRVVEVAGVASREERKWAEAIAEIEGPAGHRMALFPPVWHPDGESLLFIDDGGIYRIAMNRRHERIVEKNGIVALTIGPAGNHMAYADGERIVLTTMDGEEIASASTLAPADPVRQEVQPIAFSPAGDRIAYGAGRFLFVLDVTSMKIREVLETDDPIYWVQWLPTAGRLVFTTGLSILNLRTSTSAAPYRVERGSYKLFSVGDNGRGVRRLFEDDAMDAHLAQPALSPDGSYVAVTSGGEDAPRVVIVATDAPRVRTLTPTAVSSHPTWFAAVNPGARPCPVAVVYPLR